jgi:hypothetical protein
LDSFTQRGCLTEEKVLMWQEDSRVHFGVLVNIGGIIELHYITVQLAS